MVSESNGDILPKVPDLKPQGSDVVLSPIKNMRKELRSILVEKDLNAPFDKEANFLINNLFKRRKEFEAQIFSGKKEDYQEAMEFLSEDVQHVIFVSRRDNSPYAGELSELFVSFVSENLGKIGDAINQFGKNVRYTSFSVINHAAEFSKDDNHRKKFVDFCIEDLNRSKEPIEFTALNAVIKFTNNVDFYTRVLKELPEWINKRLEDPSSSNSIDGFCAELALDEIPYSRLEQITREICYSRGIDADKLLEAWLQTSTGSAKSDYDRASNLGAILALEKRNPGITKDLMDNFGILDFGRYPLEVLRSQAREKDETDRPYGIAIYPRSDYNGAFYSSSEYLEDIYNQFRSVPDIKRPRIKIFEAESIKDLVSILNMSRKKWGKISFAITGAHGSERNIAFGEKEENGTLNKLDLFRKGARAVREAFINQPTIILDSCSTGSLGGIAGAMSAIGGDIIAPNVSTGISEVKVTVDSRGKINFRVKYAEGDTTKHSKGSLTKIS